jgi:hypothetical protein
MADATPPGTVEGQEPPAGEGQEPSGDGKPDEGQEPQGKTYSEAYVRQLRREAAGLRSKLSEAEDKLTEHADADKSEAERLNTRATSAEQRAAEAELKLLRYEVAAEAGLDPAAVQFLSGATREELELRAEELKKLLGDKGRPDRQGFDGGARPPAPGPKGKPEEEHNALLLQALGRGRPTRS